MPSANVFVEIVVGVGAIIWFVFCIFSILLPLSVLIVIAVIIASLKSARKTANSTAFTTIQAITGNHLRVNILIDVFTKMYVTSIGARHSGRWRRFHQHLCMDELCKRLEKFGQRGTSLTACSEYGY